MILVVGTARFAPGELERLRDALARNVAATRQEEGCEHYAYAIDLDDPNLLHVAQRWRDGDATRKHMQTPHMAELMAALAEAKVEALDIHAYDATYRGPVFGGG